MAGMTSEEAIYIITGLPIYRMEQKYDNKSDLMTALTMAVEALEKQTPKKPYRMDVFFRLQFCPVCNTYVSRDQIYCDKCGQKLDWSE